MGMELRTYEEIRDRVQPGDIVAFGGYGLLSRVIKAISGSPVSHVSTIVAPSQGAEEPRVVEATVRFGEEDATVTVGTSPLRNRLDYDGDIWWLPLRPAVRARFDVGRFKRFLEEADGAPFDVGGGFFVLVRDLLQRLKLVEARELETYFCSELVAEALESGGAVGNVDGSLASPKDVCSWRIYRRAYAYVDPAERDPKEIDGYNSRRPGST